MNLATYMSRDFESPFDFVRVLKAVSAGAVYAIAVILTWMYMTLCVELSYAYGNQAVVTMWTVFLVVSVGTWFGVGWIVLALTLPKKQKDAHLALLPVSLTAVVTVAAATIISAYVGQASHSVLATNLYATVLNALAGWVLFRLFTKAVQTWRGESLWLL